MAIYDIEDTPFSEAIPLGVRHVLAMFLRNVAPPLIITGRSKWRPARHHFSSRWCIVAGVATIVQPYPMVPIGARLLMGTRFAFLGPLQGISAQNGLAAVFGAALVATPVEAIIGMSLDRFREYFPPL